MAQKDHPDINKYVHPPVVALFYMVLAYILGRFIPIFEVPGIVKNIGFVLICTGFLTGFAGVFEISRLRTTLDPHGSVSQIVSSGIYSFTRNPIYLGFLQMGIGIPLYLGSYWGIALAPIFVWTMNKLVIEKEEIYLEKKFSEAYTSYKSRVRRWF